VQREPAVGNGIVARLLAASLALGSPASSAVAQLPGGVHVDDVGTFSYSARDGLPNAVVFDVFRHSAGTLWLATDDGPYRLTGNTWERVAHPDSVLAPQVRMIAEDPDGNLWFAGRQAIYRYRAGGWMAFRAPQGTSSPPFYSVAVTRTFDGTPRVAAGSADGLFRLDDDGRFFRVALPQGFHPGGLMLSERLEGDGSTSLWMASITSGVARLHAGEWTVWGERDGLQPIVESVAVGESGDSVTAVAATYYGAFELVRGSWRRVSPPDLPVSRALRMRSGGRYETWLGSFAGTVLRRHADGAWDTLRVAEGGQVSAIAAFRAIDDKLGNAALYTGFRGGGLVRLRTGRAGKVLVAGQRMTGFVTAAREVVAPDGTTELMAYRSGFGFQRSPRGSPDRVIPPIDRFSYLINSFADARASGQGVWASGRQGMYRLSQDAWVHDDGGPFGDTLAQVIAGPLPTGGRGVLAWGAGTPLQYRDARAWRPFPGAPALPYYTIRADTLAGEEVVWVLTNSALHRYGFAARRWTRIDSIAGVQMSMVASVKAQRLASGEDVLWVATSTNGIGMGLLRPAPIAWQWTRPSTPQVVGVTVAGDGRVFCATPRGVVVLRAGRAFADQVQVVDVVGAADGLPHESVTGLSVSPRNQRLWVSTLEGLGMIPLDSAGGGASYVATPWLLARVMSATPRELVGGETLSYSERTLLLEYSLDTRHRESDTRFRVEVDGVPVSRDPWSAQRTVTLPSLASGRHVVQVWARDWRGRVSGPMQLAFAVAPPPWRSLPAFASYALALITLVVLGDRWRQSALRHRADELEANERRLAASEERFRRLFVEGADAQLLVRDGVVLAANPAAAALLGVPDRSSLTQQRLDALVSFPADQATRTGGAVEATAHHSDGTRIPVAARRSAISVQVDPFEHVELRDLREAQRLERERTQLEQQLRESQRLEALGNLAGGVAHDFNNLLTVIQGHAELVRNAGPHTPEDSESLTAILHAADRARGIVRQILTFSRRSAPLRREVELGAMLRETERMLRASIPSTVHLTVADRSGGARILGDPTEIHQLLLNLAANAEYAMRPTGGGDLSLELDLADPPTPTAAQTAWPTARCLRLRVRDTGVGMNEEVQRRIFEPFFTTKPVGEGTGLGLSVLHGIVAAHDGTVSVTSVPGRGTTFEIHFPALEGTTNGAAPPLTPEPTPIGRGRETVLVVDDEVAVAAVTALLLEAAGYRTLRCHTPSDALELVSSARAHVDLVITDQTMPGMTGDVLAEHIHALVPSLPIIIATGFSQKLLTSDLARLGVARVLEKPYSEEELLQALDDIFAPRRLAV